MGIKFKQLPLFEFSNEESSKEYDSGIVVDENGLIRITKFHWPPEDWKAKVKVDKDFWKRYKIDIFRLE